MTSSGRKVKQIAALLTGIMIPYASRSRHERPYTLFDARPSRAFGLDNPCLSPFPHHQPGGGSDGAQMVYLERRGALAGPRILFDVRDRPERSAVQHGNAGAIGRSGCDDRIICRRYQRARISGRQPVGFGRWQCGNYLRQLFGLGAVTLAPVVSIRAVAPSHRPSGSTKSMRLPLPVPRTSPYAGKG